MLSDHGSGWTEQWIMRFLGFLGFWQLLRFLEGLTGSGGVVQMKEVLRGSMASAIEGRGENGG